jgi:hypothetical protein
MSQDLTGKTVVAAANSLVEPYKSAPERDRCFFCVSKSRYGYEGFWCVDGTRGETASFLIEKVLETTPAWVIDRYPRVKGLAR